MRVADDFYLEPQMMHRVFNFCGYMITNSLAGLRKARIDFYNDCNGLPANDPFKTYTNSVVTSEVPVGGGLFLVQYCFTFCDDPLWLEGGKSYWVSLVGIADPTGNDISYWVTDPSGARMLGAVPQKAAATSAGPVWGPWGTIADCCIGCVNTIFSLQGESCPIIWDNGTVDLSAAGKGGSLSMNFSSTTKARTADDFVTFTCDDEQVCYIDAWIWTNCVPADGFIELYDSTCAMSIPGTPGGTFPGNLIANLTPIKTTATGQTATIDGAVRQGYHLEFYGVTMPTLLKGHTYWLSAGGLGGNSSNTRAYFAYSAPACPTACPTKLSKGVTRTIITGTEPWTPTTRDYAFRIAVKQPFFGNNASSGSAACHTDVNHDGVTNVLDIFDFLNTWLSGCP
jgi:hypothetical protein